MVYTVHVIKNIIFDGDSSKTSWKVVKGDNMNSCFVGSFYIETILNNGPNKSIDQIVLEFKKTEAYYNSFQKEYKDKSEREIWLETERRNDWIERIFRATYRMIVSDIVIIKCTKDEPRYTLI